MIHRQMQMAKLYEVLTKKNSFGESVPQLRWTADIEVVINFISIERRTDDLRYKDCCYNGLTVYKDFAVEKEYRLALDNEEVYWLKGINTTARLTQFLMERVV